MTTLVLHVGGLGVGPTTPSLKTLTFTKTSIIDNFINRAAMGRARFLLYPWFIFYLFFLTARLWAERGSCSAPRLLTARPWAERGSCSAPGLLFLTPWPWAKRGSCSAPGLLFLTMRPWAERGSCSAPGLPSDIALCFYERRLMSFKKRGYKLFQLLVNARFLLYPWLIFF